MKKTVCTAAAVLLAVLTLAFTAFADDTKYSHGYFYYHVHEGYVSICGYFGGEKAVEIPSSIAGRPVSEIEHNAFKGCTALKNITVDPANPAYVMKDGKLMTKDLQTQIFPVED